jgi:hypothetical protein
LILDICILRDVGGQLQEVDAQSSGSSWISDPLQFGAHAKHILLLPLLGSDRVLKKSFLDFFLLVKCLHVDSSDYGNWPIGRSSTMKQV